MSNAAAAPTAPASSNGSSPSSRGTGRDRSLDWLALLPCQPALEVEQSVPESMRRQLIAQSGAGARALVACHRPAPSHELEDFSAVVVLNPARGVASSLEERGFRHILRFAALPSLDNPRILVPLGNRLAAAASLDLLAPYRPTARLKKVALAGLARFGGAWRAGDGLLLARRQVSGLESYLQELTGHETLHLALAPGSAGEFRKLTARLMRDDGSALGFAKIGWTASACDAIGRECRMLDHLAAYPELRGRVPSLLDAAWIDGQFVSVQSSGGAKVSGSAYGPRHHAFLKTLASASARRMRFSDSAMWRSIKDSYESLAPRLATPNRMLLKRVSDEVEVALGDRELDLSIAHRDFGPWNVRLLSTGEIFVFDWETAQPEMVPAYDFFDFHSRAHVLSGKQAHPEQLARLWLARCRQWHPELEASDVPAFFLAYLLDRALSRSRYVLWRDDGGHDAMYDLLVTLLDTRAAWMAD